MDLLIGNHSGFQAGATPVDGLKGRIRNFARTLEGRLTSIRFEDDAPSFTQGDGGLEQFGMGEIYRHYQAGRVPICYCDHILPVVYSKTIIAAIRFPSRHNDYFTSLRTRPYAPSLGIPLVCGYVPQKPTVAIDPTAEPPWCAIVDVLPRQSQNRFGIEK